MGVSVVNALSYRLEAEIRRNGVVYSIAFAHGDKASDLKEIGTVGKKTPAHRFASGQKPDTSIPPNFPLPSSNMYYVPRPYYAPAFT